MEKYIRLPYELMTSPRYAELSVKAKVLYAFMLDLRGLSEKKDFRDSNGNVYIIFTVDMAKMLIGASHSTVSTLFAELEQFGLISRVKKGFTQVRTYVYDIVVENDVENLLNNVEMPSEGNENISSSTAAYQEIGQRASDNQTSSVRKSDTIHTKDIHTDLCFFSVRQAAGENGESDGAKAQGRKTFQPDIEKERRVLEELKAKCNYATRFSSDEPDVRLIELRKFTDSLLRSFVGILCHHSFITDANGEFLDADDSGNGYANYLKAQELKEKIAEHERCGGFFAWIEICFERWNVLVNAKQERGEPIRRKDRYFPKFLDSFIRGEYDLDEVKSAGYGAHKSYSERSSYGGQRKAFDDYTSYFDTRGGRPFEMPDLRYTPFGRKNVSDTKPACDEWAEKRAEEQDHENRREQALDKLMRYGS